MKINRLEAHDRLQYLIKDQSEVVQQGAEDCLKKNAEGSKFRVKLVVDRWSILFEGWGYHIGNCVGRYLNLPFGCWC